MKTSKYTFLAIILVFTFSCSNQVIKWGQHYQKHQDFQSLKAVLDHLPKDADTSTVQSILGEPIDMGFDYRYLLDSMGPNGCVIGAVFHIQEGGKIGDKWIGEICE